MLAHGAHMEDCSLGLEVRGRRAASWYSLELGTPWTLWTSHRSPSTVWTTWTFGGQACVWPLRGSIVMANILPSLMMLGLGSLILKEKLYLLEGFGPSGCGQGCVLTPLAWAWQVGT